MERDREIKRESERVRHTHRKTERERDNMNLVAENKSIFADILYLFIKRRKVHDGKR